MSQDPNELSDPSDATILRRFIEFRLADLHTAMPGRVLAFDAAANTVDVQPLLKRVFVSADGTETPESAPQISAVPIWYPRGGGFRVTWDLVPGDIVLLVFVERSIDTWASAGGEVVPFPARKHDWSDAIALPGLAPTSSAIANVTGCHVGREDGTAELHIAADGTVVLKGLTVALGDEGGPAVARVGDMLQIDNDSAPDFFAWMVAAASAGPGVAPVYTGKILGRIISGSPKVTST